jgi:undecaprenyl-diphosphatase
VLPLFYLFILAAVQGLTEFLPISSSAHLILAREGLNSVTAVEVNGGFGENLALDVAVHVGSLFAVLLYFRRDIMTVVVGGVQGLFGRRIPGWYLALNIVVATIPVVIVGYFGHGLIRDYLRTSEIIAWTTLLFGILLYLADRRPTKLDDLDRLSIGQALLIGLAQTLALVPGVSRSGITMTAARALGIDRYDAARFSLLLSIPAILGAGSLIAAELYRTDSIELTSDMIVAAALAFVIALAAIAGMMSWLRRSTFAPFVAYRIVLGVVLLAFVYA